MTLISFNFIKCTINYYFFSFLHNMHYITAKYELYSVLLNIKLFKLICIVCTLS